MSHATLVDALLANAGVSERGMTFVDRTDVFVSYAELSAAAEDVARRLLAAGLTPGDRLALVLPDPHEFVVAFLGAVRARVVPVPMYPPVALGRLDAYMAGAKRILGAAGARALLTGDSLRTLLFGLTDGTLRAVHTLGSLPAAVAGELPLPKPQDTCFLQFTSGSTSDPKGVVVTHENLIANNTSTAIHGVDLRPERDRLVSWLPLYHDMGLIGFVVAPVLLTLPVWLLPTLSFVRHPNLWLETMHRVRGTASFAPNFAFALAARRAPKPLPWDLSCVRFIGCGAEPIHADTLRRFVATFAPCGLRPDAVMPAYGLAEATLGVAFKPAGEVFRTLAVDAAELGATGRVRAAAPDAAAVELVSCGRVLPGFGCEIVDEAGRSLGEGEEGEVVLFGPSVTSGYHGDPAATARCRVRGGMRTGDLGFLLDGELWLSGRRKDLVILNGRNHHPQSIEWVAAQVPGVRPGNVVAFARPGAATEELVLVLERKKDGPEPDVLAERVADHVRAELALPVADVVVLPPGGLPKTSSGKLQRSRARDQYLSGQLGRDGIRLDGAADRVVLARHLARGAWNRVRAAFP